MEQEGTQYQILDKIDVGGMAEIFRAKNLDNNEIMAIKRILPALGQQPEFVDMFVDEAVICMALEHKNIVRVHQLGMMDGDLFLAMEYVAGINLRDLLNYASANDFEIPVHEALLIAIRILDGLEYAHHKVDKNGEPLNIIHRDISPPNILLGYNGDVKITDFGLVKSKTQMTHTIPGLIKGKFSYLSPEAAYGESIDPRSDIYAVGIILWEMLTRRPLYSDPVEVKILDLVRRSIIPPIEPINPMVTHELELIILKGLARSREQRYQSAKEFADALREYYKKMGAPKSQLNKIVAMVKPPADDPILDEIDLNSSEATTVSQMIPIKEFEDALEKEIEEKEIKKTKKITKTTKTKKTTAKSKQADSNKPLYIAIAILAFVLIALMISFSAFGI